MKRFLLLSFVCSLFSVVRGADDITCASCSVEETNCNTNCTAQTCIALRELNTLKSANGTYRGCLSENRTCNPLAFTFSTDDNQQVQSSVACCTTEMCNDKLSLSAPPTSTVENGAHCAVCEAYNKSTCESTKKIACKGAEIKCITLSGESLQDKNETFAIKGCATESACTMVKGDPLSYGSKIYQLSENPACINQGTLAALSSVIIILPAVVPLLMTSVLS
nr:phospholipase A2 inhibitor and Ly6/PLAUR domain-containing protein-like [Pogona vitticeps]